MSSGKFIGRWSQRKLAKKQAGPGGEKTTEATPETEQELTTSSDNPVTAKQDGGDEIVRDLPKIEELGAESDYRPFLQDGVPDELRNLALRRLWRSNPVIANVDGLNDYDEDFAVARPLAVGLAEELTKLMKDTGRTSSTPDDTTDPDSETLENGRDGFSSESEESPRNNMLADSDDEVDQKVVADDP